MADLPPPFPHTTEAVYAELAKGARGADSAGISMSEATNPCDRALWYALRWAAEPRPFDGMKPMDDRLPPDQRGSIWLTPHEIARRALREPDLATFKESFKAVRRP